jgi:hypothetical protein
LRYVTPASWHLAITELLLPIKKHVIPCCLMLLNSNVVTGECTFSATPHAASLAAPVHMLGQSLLACYGLGTQQYPSRHAQYSSPDRDLKEIRETYIILVKMLSKQVANNVLPLNSSSHTP